MAVLVAAGYTVSAVNPLQAARFRERHAVSGAKSDDGDRHVLAGLVEKHQNQLERMAEQASQGPSA